MLRRFPFDWKTHAPAQGRSYLFGKAKTEGISFFKENLFSIEGINSDQQTEKDKSIRAEVKESSVWERF